MAQRKSKKNEAPQVDIGAEIFASLRDLEKIKGIPVTYMVERLKQALTNAYRRDREDHKDIPAENVVVDLSEKGLFMYSVKTAVEEVEDPAIEMHIDTARNLNPDVQLTLCLLNAIDNPRRDIYLTGLMLSPLFEFTADELQKAKKEGRKTSLWESINVYSNKKSDERLTSFINTLNKYREIAEGVRTDALILKLYNETGLFALAEKNGGKENLLLLYNYARKFESSSFEGLYNFITYLNEAIASGAKFSAESENTEDAVSIITAHKSKGLEFPVVFIADVGTPLVAASERRSKIAYSDDFGFAMKTRADGGLATVNSPIYNVIIEHNVDVSLEEELRVYYVALTRAR
jgi:ATP-dependent helicase/nuclease subunit A